MLDAKTKKIIDSARDILVGKLPAPNTQVEQITLAMLYKFMDDIDQETTEMGGEAIYFSKDFEKYSWREIMKKSYSSQQRMNLYVEALEKFYIHPNLPKTFKSIFKNATVPYRDPEVLTLFLNEIDSLNYEDSEVLGDAYEYLLNILGSQGDLGQFRTPRHIIDFIVEAVNPQKDDKILDPACGTAGFLISSYRHIINAKENQYLNYDDKKKILSNITGYDIEPSMVKIAEMNMYLHGCTEPDINEYDTLTSDDRWDDKFDVILANPPFMTPKGGINPHNKFSVKANRAEILFVDYIFEHVKSRGRGGIVVPDGIVSNAGKQSAAYKKLREFILSTNSIYSVVSLHPYVFKPYADVKTSIILFDKSIITDKVLFINVENDGKEKGERRRDIEKNDLPEALHLIKEYQNLLKNGENIEFESFDSKVINNIVDLDTIKKLSFILRGERYLVGKEISEKIDKYVLSDIVDKVSLKSDGTEIIYSVSKNKGFIASAEYFNEYYSVSTKGKYLKVNKGCFAFNPSRINVGSIAYFDSEEIGCISPMYKLFKIKDKFINIVNPYYLLAVLKSKIAQEFINNKTKGVRNAIDIDNLLEFEIAIPSEDKQIEIAQKMKTIYDMESQIGKYNYIVSLDEKWDKKEISELFDVSKGGIQISKNEEGQYKLVSTAEIVPSNYFEYDGEAICIPLISAKGHGVAQVGNIFYIKGKFCVGDILSCLVPKKDKNINVKFYYYLFNSYKDMYFKRLMTGTSNVGFTIDDLKGVLIPYPKKEEQDSIVTKGEPFEMIDNYFKTSQSEIIEQIDLDISKLYM